MMEILIIGAIGSFCIVWVLVCVVDIFNLDIWRD